MWTLEKAGVTEKPRLTIQTAKLLFTILWSARWFHVVDCLPDGATMNSTYFVDNVLKKTPAVFFPFGRTERSPTLTLHLDNCSLHRSLMTQNVMGGNGMQSVPHPPYSSDLALSAFDLFPLMKHRLDRCECEDPDDLLESIHEMPMALRPGKLEHVFRRWIERVRTVDHGDTSSITD